MAKSKPLPKPEDILKGPPPLLGPDGKPIADQWTKVPIVFREPHSIEEIERMIRDMAPLPEIVKGPDPRTPKPKAPVPVYVAPEPMPDMAWKAIMQAADRGLGCEITWPISCTWAHSMDTMCVWVTPLVSDFEAVPVSDPWFSMSGQVVKDIEGWWLRLPTDSRSKLMRGAGVGSPPEVGHVIVRMVSIALADVSGRVSLSVFADMEEAGVKLKEGEAMPHEWEAEFALRVAEEARAPFRHFILTMSSAAQSRVQDETPDRIV